MNRISQLPVGKPMRLMTQAEKIAEFQRRIDDVTDAEAATAHGQAYLALVRAQKRREGHGWATALSCCVVVQLTIRQGGTSSWRVRFARLPAGIR